MQRVVVAMSGGVDSSVAAAILKESGFEVIGITMKLWQEELNEKFGSCCSLSAIEDTKKVAHLLDIPHYVLNFKELFKKKVIYEFYREYISGKTPNPCISCNRSVKFEALLHRAMELKADYVATGHYARIEYDNKRKRYILKKGFDKNKDQSYVLYTMTQNQLKHTLFPVGRFTKQEVRNIARQFKLPVFDKKDSQEICFVEDDDYSSFLRRCFNFTSKEGNIVDIEGRVLGKHRGIINYTIGQRRGLGISAKRPLYVIKINADRNEVITGPKEKVYSDRLFAKCVNLISFKSIKWPLKVKAKIRYKSIESDATVSLVNSRTFIKFKKPQWAVTPGQSVVFYNGEEVIGGGIIDI